MKLTVENVSFSYDRKVPVLSKVSLEAADGRPVAVMAPSGAGKTTLLRLICGLEKPQEGRILLCQQEEGKENQREAGQFRCSVVFQEDRLFPGFSVYENLKIVKKDLQREEAAALLEKLQMEEAYLDKNVMELSGGQKRRTALARALLYEAPVVLMDEPFTGLDKKSKQAVIDTVRTSCEKRILILATHQEEEARASFAQIFRLTDRQAPPSR